MGDRDQGSHAEVPQPHEPQCFWSGCPGQEGGLTRPFTQHQATQHRVGPSFHGKVCKSDGQGHL